MHFRQRLPNGIRSSGQLKDNYLDGKSGKACHGGKYYLFASPKEGVYHTVLLLPLSFLNFMLILFIRDIVLVGWKCYSRPYW